MGYFKNFITFSYQLSDTNNLLQFLLYFEIGNFWASRLVVGDVDIPQDGGSPGHLQEGRMVSGGRRWIWTSRNWKQHVQAARFSCYLGGDHISFNWCQFPSPFHVISCWRNRFSLSRYFHSCWTQHDRLGFLSSLIYPEQRGPRRQRDPWTHRRHSWCSSSW